MYAGPPDILPRPKSPDITAVCTAGMTIPNVHRPPGDPTVPAEAGLTKSKSDLGRAALTLLLRRPTWPLGD